ncbi:MAG: hypothetical protein ABSC19_12740 [Syntrophorhabdales bacterium]
MRSTLLQLRPFRSTVPQYQKAEELWDRPVVHILDLLFEGPAVWKDARRKGPGYSERHENRSRLKGRMLSGVFDEKGEGDVEPHEGIVLYISPEVRERVEERRRKSPTIRSGSKG